jgi:hypothetical protein
MQIQGGIPVLAAAVTAVLLQACERPLPSEQQSSAALAAVKLDVALCAPDRGGFTLQSTNAYFPLQVGRRWVLEGEEGGVPVHLEIEVLRDTEVVAGVTTHVIEERESQGGELVEDSRNFFAEAGDGTVCYFGEAVDMYEGGQIISHEGSWRADEPGNHPGIIMPANPHPGLRFEMEGAPGVAEDEGTIVGTGKITVPAGTFTETIRVRELNRLDGSRDEKVYAANVGILIDPPVVLVSY